MINKLKIIFTAVLCMIFSGCTKIQPLDIGYPEITTAEIIEPPEITTVPEPEVTEPTTVVTTQSFVPTTPTDFDREYLDQCVFVGDSVCSGLRVYSGLLDADQVFAAGNLGARSLHDYTVTYKGEELPIMDAIAKRQPKYVYLWMGLNDINMTTKEQYAENLYNIAIEAMNASPYSYVCILSMTPTSIDHPWKANDRIKEYNEEVRKMCEENEDKHIYFLNVWDAVVNTSGYLPDECNGGDGLHLSPYAYQLVLGYVSANQINYGTEFPVSTETEPTVTETEPTVTETGAETSEVTQAPSGDAEEQFNSDNSDNSDYSAYTQNETENTTSEFYG